VRLARVPAAVQRAVLAVLVAAGRAVGARARGA
jgi:hypothetical protein